MRFLRLILISIFVIMTLLSCSNKKDKVANVIIDTGKEGNNLKKFLKTLPKKEADDSQTPYAEISMFLKGRDEVIKKDYAQGFETLARFLYTFPSSFHKSEASYLLGKTVIYMLESNPLYIKEFYQILNEETTTNSNTDNFEDSQPEKFSIDNVYKQLGIVEKDGNLSFNGEPFKRILRDEDSRFLLNDFAYYYSIRHRFSDIKIESDEERFGTNVMLLEALSDRYRTSVLQSILYSNKSYFPDSLPFKLNRTELAEYNSVKKNVLKRIKDIEPEYEKQAYVIGNGIIIRDRIVMPNAGKEKNLTKLQNYNFVTILKSKDIYNRQTREKDNWVLVEYDTFYGPLVGWAYGQYFTNDSNLAEVFDTYKNAMTAYDNYYYIEASNLFSGVLSYANTNYFTDKSAYFLWRLNNKVGDLVTSKDNPYYNYVEEYPKYFYYNTNTSILHSSTLLYNYLTKIMPDSPYKFRISGDSETVYNTD